MESLFESIRRAALDPDAWNDVQKEAQVYMGAMGCQLASVDHGNNNLFWSRSTIEGLDDYLALAGPNCEPVQYTSTRPHWRTFCDYDYISEQQMARSEFYRDNELYGIRYRLALRLVDHPTVSKAMLFFWNTTDGHPQSAEIDKLDLLTQQLRLSAFVATTLGASLEREQLLLDTLARTERAALIVDNQCRVIQANECAEEIIRAADGIGIREGCLFVDFTDLRSKVQATIRQAGYAALEPTGTGGGSVAIPRPSLLPPYILTAVPLSRQQQFLGKDRGLVLVLIHDPTRGKRLVREILMDAFGLSVAEAEVAQAFSSGTPTYQLARDRQVSVVTVRNQMKSIMAKIGVQRQSDLARLLERISAAS